MPVSKNFLDDYEKYAIKYLVTVRDILDCKDCSHKCEDHTVEVNYRKLIVDNLDECPCYKEKETGIWRPEVAIQSGENCTIRMIEKRDNLDRTVIIVDGKIIKKPDDVDILGIETPSGFEVRGLKRRD